MRNDSDLDRLDAGPTELTVEQRRGLIRGLLVAIALVIVVIAVVAPGPAPLLDRDPDGHRTEGQALSAPSETAKPIALDAVEGPAVRKVQVSILDWPRTERDVLPEWAVAKLGPAVADSARLAVTHAEFDVFVAGSHSSPCLLVINRNSQLVHGDCVTNARFFAGSGDDAMSVSAVEVDCVVDAVLIPDDYKLKIRRGSVVSAGPNVAVFAPTGVSPRVYGLQTQGQTTVRFGVSAESDIC